MSDSDDDYIDIGEVEVENDVEESESGVQEKSSNGRGKDIEWIEMARFKDKAAYETSLYFLDIRGVFHPETGERE